MPARTCTPATSEAIAAAASALHEGKLVILPTDTVYGIAADIRHDAAVEQIFAAKARPESTPLQLLFPVEGPDLQHYCVLTQAAEQFVQSAGPGPWTIIVPAAAGWTSPALAGGATVGIRQPDHPILQAVLGQLGAPVAATSANRHGAPSPATCAEAVGGVGAACALALDGGLAAGIDSTVIDLSGEEPVILREGAIDRQTVARILGVATITVVRSVRPDAPR